MSDAAVGDTRGDPTPSPRQLYDGRLRSTEIPGGDRGKISASRGTKEEPLGPIPLSPRRLVIAFKRGFLSVL